MSAAALEKARASAQRRRPLVAIVAAVVAAGIVAAVAIAATGGGGTPGGFALTATIDKALLGSVACWSTSSCVAVGAVGDEGEVWFLSNGKVTSARAVVGTVRLVSVACAGGAQCVAGGSAVGPNPSGSSSAPSVGAIVAIDGGGIGSAVGVAGVQVVTDVACWSTTGCDAVGDTASAGAVISLSSGLVVSVTPAPTADGTFESISCGAPESCEIASFLNPKSNNSSGLLVSLDNGVFGTPRPVARTFGLWGIACRTATNCVAVGLARTSAADYEGIWVTVTSGHPGSVVRVSGSGDLFSVSCPSSSRCEAVGAKAGDTGGVGTAIVVGTTAEPGKATQAAGASYFSIVTCPSTASCLTVGHAGANSVVEQIDPSAPPAA